MDTVQIVSPDLFPEGDSPERHLEGVASEFNLRNPVIAHTLLPRRRHRAVRHGDTAHQGMCSQSGGAGRIRRIVKQAAPGGRRLRGPRRSAARAKDIGERCRDRGMLHGKALKAVARKRLEVIYAIMGDKVPYAA